MAHITSSKVNLVSKSIWKRLSIPIGLAFTWLFAWVFLLGYLGGEAYAHADRAAAVPSNAPLVMAAQNETDTLTSGNVESETEPLRSLTSSEVSQDNVSAPELCRGAESLTNISLGVSNEPSSSNTGNELTFWSTGDLDQSRGNDDGNLEIFLAEAVAPNQFAFTQVTSSTGSILGGFNLSPVISADGKLIAFFSDRDLLPPQNKDENFEIFLADFSGAGAPVLTQVTVTTVGSNIFPSISCDGETCNNNKYSIAFVSDNDLTGDNSDGNQEIFVVRFEDGNLQPIKQVTKTTDKINDDPVISGDGQAVAFTQDDGELYFASISDTPTITPTQITSSDDDVFNEQPSISNLIESPNGEKYYDIAFASNRTHTETLNIFLAKVSVDGELQTNPNNPPAITNDPDYSSDQPSISADGVRIAFASSANFPDGNNAEHNSQIWVYDADTQSFNQLTNNQLGEETNNQPSLSLNGTQVAFISQGTLYQTRCPYTDLQVEVKAPAEIQATGRITAGASLVYEIKAINFGPLEATGVKVTETVPANTIFDEDHPSSEDWNCGDTTAGTVCEFFIGDMEGLSYPVDEEVQFAVNVLSNVFTGTELTNTVGIVGEEIDQRIDNNTDVLTNTVLRDTQLFIEVSTEQNVIEPGDSITYTITIINEGSSDVLNATARSSWDDAPDAEFLSADNGGVKDTQTSAIWEDLVIPASDPPVPLSLKLTLELSDSVLSELDFLTNTVKVRDEGFLNNEAENKTASEVMAEPDLDLSKTDNLLTISPDEEIVYTITVSNNGNQNATMVNITDTFPYTTTSFIEATDNHQPDSNNVLSWTLSSLLAGETKNFTVRVEVNPTFTAGIEQIYNRAGVKDDGINSNQAGVPIIDSAEDLTTLLAEPDLILTKTDKLQDVEPEQVVTYMLTVTNDGDQEATNVTLTDTLPFTTTTFIEATDGIVPVDNILTWDEFDLLAKKDKSFTVTVTVKPTFTTGIEDIHNRAGVKDDGQNSNELGVFITHNDFDTTTLLAEPDLILTKTDKLQNMEPEQVVTYMLTVTNNGTQEATNVILTDTLPYTTTSFVAATDGIVPASNILTWDEFNVPAQQKRVFTVTVDVNDTFPPEIENIYNRAGVKDDGSNSQNGEPTQDDDDDTNRLDAEPTFSLTMNDGVTEIMPGEIITYVLTVANTGTQDATGVVLTNTLPNYTIYIADSASDSGTYLANTHQIRWTIGNLDVGQTESRMFMMLITDTVPVEVLTNSAIVTDDGVNGNNNAIISATKDDPNTVRAQLGDLVWEDWNGDGIYQTTEEGLPGVTVTLHYENNTPYETTVTDNNGVYTFTYVPSDTYYLRFTPPSPYTFTLPNIGAPDPVSDTVDSDPYSTGRTENFSSFPAFRYRKWDAGLYRPATVGNFVWQDIDGDGIQDNDEPGVEDVTVTLYRVSDDVSVGSDVTDSSGMYSITNVPPETYYLRFTLPSGYSFTLQGEGGDNEDSDPDPATGETEPFTLVSNQTDNSHDAGAYRPASLGDFVWEDTDGDGIQGGTESGLPGITVTLYQTSDDLMIGSDVTDANGVYSIGNIPPEEYYLVFTPTGSYRFTLQDEGSDDDIDSDPDSTGRTDDFILLSNQSDNTRDAGLYRSVTIGDLVWEDINGNGMYETGEPGVENVNVALLRTSDDETIATAQTDANGFYSIENVPPENYYLRFTPPNGYSFTLQDQGIDIFDSDPDPATGETDPFTVISDQTDNSRDAGLYRPVTVGDLAWEDQNGDGIRDTSEPGVGGVTVTLYRASDDVNIGSDVTNVSGTYTIDNIPPENYYLVFTPPSPYTFTLPNINQPLSDTLDSDPDPATGRTATFTLISGQISDTHDAGLYRPATVGNLVWVDTDGDGIRDTGESGLPGVNVTLIRVSDNNVMGSNTTNANGIYSISGLPPESYYLRFTAPSPYTFTLQNQVPDTLDSDADPATGETDPFFLTSAQTDNTRDAGLYLFATVGDRVWEDKNGDGIRVDTESGLPGITVTLYRTSDDLMIDFDVTNSNGFYSMTNIPPEDYYLVFTPTGSYRFTLQDQLTNDEIDSDADSTGRTDSFTLVSNQISYTLDAGLYQPITVSNRVWIDTNGNGIQDDGPTAQAGVTVRLRRASNGALIDTATTNATGIYQIGNLRPDQYYLQFTNLPTNYVLTLQDQGGDDTLDSDPDPLTSETTVFTLTSGFSEDKWDAGIALAATVGNFVWQDTDGDGIQDGAEPGVENVTVTLYRASDNREVDEVSTTNTGAYTITNVPPGEYYLEFTDLPAGSILTQQGQGSSTTDSDPSPLNGRTNNFTLTAGQEDDTWDAGVYESTSINGVIWEDDDGDGTNNAEDGILGVTVNLVVGVIVIQTTDTDAQGNYMFNDLSPGIYTVRVDTTSTPLSGMEPTNDPDNTLPENEATVTLASGGNVTLDFGYATPVTIGNLIWEDTNGDGTRDAGENGIPNVTIDLELPDGTTNSTTNTGGNYSFTGLLPGTYTVTVTSPAGMLPTNDPDGTNPPDHTAVLLLTSGDTQYENTVNFGYASPVTIRGLLWQDINGDGTDNGGAENGLSGIPIALQHASRPPLSTDTDNNGNYSFTNLLPGTYDVIVDASQLPVTATLPTYDRDGTDTPDAAVTPQLNSGNALNNINFGYRGGFCNDTDFDINNSTPTIMSDINIPVDGYIIDMNVAITVTHGRMGDLVFDLEHIDSNTTIDIADFTDETNCDNQNMTTILDDEADEKVEAQCSNMINMIDGIFEPTNLLSGFDSQSVNGTWRLTVSDTEAGPNIGTLVEWCLLPTTTPSPPGPVPSPFDLNLSRRNAAILGGRSRFLPFVEADYHWFAAQ